MLKMHRWAILVQLDLTAAFNQVGCAFLPSYIDFTVWWSRSPNNKNLSHTKKKTTYHVSANLPETVNLQWQSKQLKFTSILIWEILKGFPLWELQLRIPNKKRYWCKHKSVYLELPFCFFCFFVLVSLVQSRIFSLWVLTLIKIKIWGRNSKVQLITNCIRPNFPVFILC